VLTNLFVHIVMMYLFTSVKASCIWLQTHLCSIKVLVKN